MPSPALVTLPGRYLNAGLTALVSAIAAAGSPPPDPGPESPSDGRRWMNPAADPGRAGP